ncbi:MAG: MarR family transcriptional regulator [Pseudomonadota bacterium]|nr:MarR family transcriptional regulator [Pseudomonadota bacterium]
MNHDASSELIEPIDIDNQPGYYIRRLHQISVAIFLQETEAFGVTPVQYAALQTVGNHPSIDQRTLARTIGLDTSTVAGVIDRLESRGLLVRSASPEDRRVRQLTLTATAHDLLAEIGPSMLKAQQLILGPLSTQEQTDFIRMLRQVVTANNELSRAPSDRGREA